MMMSATELAKRIDDAAELLAQVSAILDELRAEVGPRMVRVQFVERAPEEPRMVYVVQHPQKGRSAQAGSNG